MAIILCASDRRRRLTGVDPAPEGEPLTMVVPGSAWVAEWLQRVAPGVIRRVAGVNRQFGTPHLVLLAGRVGSTGTVSAL